MPNTVSTQATSDLSPKLVRAEQGADGDPARQPHLPGHRLRRAAQTARHARGDEPGPGRSRVRQLRDDVGRVGGGRVPIWSLIWESKGGDLGAIVQFRGRAVNPSCDRGRRTEQLQPSGVCNACYS
jgi:hypothetical protein